MVRGPPGGGASAPRKRYPLEAPFAEAGIVGIVVADAAVESEVNGAFSRLSATRAKTSRT